MSTNTALSRVYFPPLHRICFISERSTEGQQEVHEIIIKDKFQGFPDVDQLRRALRRLFEIALELTICSLRLHVGELAALLHEIADEDVRAKVVAYTLFASMIDIVVILWKLLATTPRELVKHYVDYVQNKEHAFAFFLMYPEAILNDVFIYLLPLIPIARLTEYTAIAQGNPREILAKLRYKIGKTRVRLWFNITALRPLYEIVWNILTKEEQVHILAENLLLGLQDTRVPTANLLAHLLATSALAQIAYLNKISSSGLGLKDIKRLLVLRLAALLHDIVKLCPSRWKDHAEEGGKVIEELLNVLSQGLRKIPEDLAQYMPSIDRMDKELREVVQEAADLIRCHHDKCDENQYKHLHEYYEDRLLIVCLKIGDYASTSIDRLVASEVEVEEAQRRSIERLLTAIKYVLGVHEPRPSCVDLLCSGEPTRISKPEEILNEFSCAELLSGANFALGFALIHGEFRHIKQFVEHVTYRVQLAGGSKLIDEESFFICPLLITVLCHTGFENAVITGGGKFLVLVPPQYVPTVSGLFSEKAEDIEHIFEPLPFYAKVQTSYILANIVYNADLHELRVRAFIPSTGRIVEHIESAKTVSVPVLTVLMLLLACETAVYKILHRDRGGEVYLPERQCEVCGRSGTLIRLGEIIRDKQRYEEFVHRLCAELDLPDCKVVEKVLTSRPLVEIEYICRDCLAKSILGALLRERRCSVVRELVKNMDLDILYEHEMEFIGFGWKDIDKREITTIPDIACVKSDGSLMRVISNTVTSFTDLYERNLRIDRAMRTAQLYTLCKLVEVTRDPHVLPYILLKLGLGFAYAGGDDFLALMSSFIAPTAALSLSFIYTANMGFATLLQTACISVNAKAPLMQLIEATAELLDHVKKRTRKIALELGLKNILKLYEGLAHNQDTDSALDVPGLATQCVHVEGRFTTDKLVSEYLETTIKGLKTRVDAHVILLKLVRASDTDRVVYRVENITSNTAADLATSTLAIFNMLSEILARGRVERIEQLVSLLFRRGIEHYSKPRDSIVTDAMKEIRELVHEIYAHLTRGGSLEDNLRRCAAYILREYAREPNRVAVAALVRNLLRLYSTGKLPVEDVYSVVRIMSGGVC